MTTATGTPYYWCPEVWEGKPYSFKGDMWSLGVILYELWALKPPFNASDIPGLFNKVLKGKYDRIPKEYSNDLSKIIDMCLSIKPSGRPQASKLVKNKVVMRHLDNNEELKVNLDLSPQILLDTIQPSSNMNLLQNRLPPSRYKAKAQSSKNVPDIKGPFSEKGKNKSGSKSKMGISNKTEVSSPYSSQNIPRFGGKS